MEIPAFVIPALVMIFAATMPLFFKPRIKASAVSTLILAVLSISLDGYYGQPSTFIMHTFMLHDVLNFFMLFGIILPVAVNMNVKQYIGVIDIIQIIVSLICPFLIVDLFGSCMNPCTEKFFFVVSNNTFFEWNKICLDECFGLPMYRVIYPWIRVVGYNV